MKPILTVVCALLFAVSTYAQDRPEALKDLYSKIQFDQLFPSSKVNGMDKLTQEEKDQLKNHFIDLLSTTYAMGVKSGSETAFKSIEIQIKEFMAKQEVASVLATPDTQYTNTQESKTRKALKIFALALQSFSQHFPPQDYQPPAYTPPPQTTLLSSTMNKRSITKVIDNGKYVLLDDNSLWEVDSLNTLTSSLWMSVDQIIVFSSEFKTKLLNSRDNKSVTAKRVK